jgi:hypothetical protein
MTDKSSFPSSKMRLSNPEAARVFPHMAASAVPDQIDGGRCSSGIVRFDFGASVVRNE